MTARGERRFATGDRLMLLRNERGLGVKNGTLGTVAQVSEHEVRVTLDGGDREVAFDLKSYADIDHGYAATIHKAQGVTVDRAYVLASDHMDHHATYVALSRHRDGVELHYGCDSFADEQRLARTLSRERLKDRSLDYVMPETLDAAQAPSRAPQRTDWRRALEVDGSHDMSDQRPDFIRERGLER